MTSQNATPPTGKEIGQYIDATLRSRLCALLADRALPPLRVGNLPTMNQDEYPSLGRWWVQLWAGDEVFARVYGETPQQAKARAVALASVPVAGEARPDGYAYRYQFGDGTVVRFNNGGEVNGSRPIESIPHWLGAAPQATSNIGRLMDAAHTAVEILDNLSDHADAQLASVELSSAAAAIAVHEQAAPQASEAVPMHKLAVAALNDLLIDIRAELGLGTTEEDRSILDTIRALKTQADKDGGDCAKGAGNDGGITASGNVRDTGKDRLAFHIWALVRGMDITLNDSCGYQSPLTQRAWMRWNPTEPAALAAQPSGNSGELAAQKQGDRDE